MREVEEKLPGPWETELSNQAGVSEKLRRIPIPREFHQKSNLKAAFLILLHVAIILGCGPLAYAVHRWWAYALAFLLVGARAQALYILQHECMHWLLFTNKPVNTVVGVAISGLIGTRLFDGRRFHFKHHREVGGPTDPNMSWHDTKGREPGWPAARFFMVQLLGSRLIGVAQRVLLLLNPQSRIRREKPSTSSAARENRDRKEVMADMFSLLFSQALVFGFMTIVSSPWVYVFLFLLPIVTLTSFFEAIRAFSEHVLPGEIPTCPAEHKRLFYMDAPKWERFFISQFGFHYHHLHHLYPNIVTFKLQDLHRWLEIHDPDYQRKFIRRPGYVGTAVAYIFHRPVAGAGLHYPKVRGNA